MMKKALVTCVAFVFSAAYCGSETNYDYKKHKKTYTEKPFQNLSKTSPYKVYNAKPSQKASEISEQAAKEFNKFVKINYSQGKSDRKFWNSCNDNTSALSQVLLKPTIEFIVGAEYLGRHDWKRKDKILLAVATLFEQSALELAYRMKDVCIEDPILLTSTPEGYKYNKTNPISAKARNWVIDTDIPTIVATIRNTAQKLLDSVKHSKSRNLIRNKVFTNLPTGEYIIQAEKRLREYANTPKDENGSKDTSKVTADINELETTIADIWGDDYKAIFQSFKYPRTFYSDIWKNMQDKDFSTLIKNRYPEEVRSKGRIINKLKTQVQKAKKIH